MSTHKHYIPILLILFAVLIAVFVHTQSKPSLPLLEAIATTTTRTATTSATKPTIAPRAAVLVADATLKVGSTTYPLILHSDETVIEAMRELSAAGDLAFTGRQFPGLGFFVDSLNGIQNTGGKYWVFYLNGVSSTEGASSVVLKKGDVVEWKFRNKQ
jgi:hypothetical protein